MTRRRLAALLFVLALIGWTPAARAQMAVPVLTYHAFTEHADSARGLTEPYARFVEMMRFLKRRGFRSAFPDEIERGEADPRRSVVITFDDGPRDQLRAAEIMERYGFRGIFFVIPASPRSAHLRMTQADMERLARAGHRVAPHGYRHQSLVLSGAETAAALTRSDSLVRANLPAGHPLPDFAFPFGHYGEEIAAAMAGRYRYLHTVNPGYWDGRSPLVPRMLLSSDVPLEFFQRYVTGGRDYRPVATRIGPDGQTGDTVRFRVAGRLPEGELAVLAITADAAGRMYNVHPLADNVAVAGDTLVVDMRGHMTRYFPPDRRVISFALVTRTARGMRYVSPGYIQWMNA